MVLVQEKSWGSILCVGASYIPIAYIRIVCATETSFPLVLCSRWSGAEIPYVGKFIEYGFFGSMVVHAVRITVGYDFVSCLDTFVYIQYVIYCLIE